MNLRYQVSRSSWLFASRIYYMSQTHFQQIFLYLENIRCIEKTLCTLHRIWSHNPRFLATECIAICHISFTRTRNLPVQKPARFLKNLFATKCRKIFNFFSNFRYNIIQSIKHGNVYRAKFIHCKTKCKLKFFRKNIKLQILYILRILCTLFISRNIVKL